MRFEYKFDTPLAKGLVFKLLYRPPMGLFEHWVIFEVNVWWRLHVEIEWGKRLLVEK